jgi:hypothetical protein
MRKLDYHSKPEIQTDGQERLGEVDNKTDRPNSPSKAGKGSIS